MSRDHGGMGNVMPSEPLVRLFQLFITTCADSSSAIVMMTNAWLWVRSTMAPSTMAATRATTAPSGAASNGLTSARIATMAAVYPPRPRNALWPREM
jgi:hypothetical protein